MSPLRMIFLGLAIWGAIHPMYYFVMWFNANGYDIMAMVDAWHVNPAGSGLVWDLTIAAIALTVWIVSEVSVRRNWLALVAIPGDLLYRGQLWLALVPFPTLSSGCLNFSQIGNNPAPMSPFFADYLLFEQKTRHWIGVKK